MSFYIYSDVTHTHTHPAGTGSTLKGKREKKRTQRTGQGQNSAGGRGTNGPPEPTYTARRTWPTQSTHLNPTTHYRGARGKNWGPNGGLVGDESETTKLLLKGFSSCPSNRALLPAGNVVKSSRMGINSYSGSSELNARYVLPTSPNTNETIPAGVACSRSCHISLQKAWASAKKRFVVARQGIQFIEKCKFQGYTRTAEAAGHL